MPGPEGWFQSSTMFSCHRGVGRNGVLSKHHQVPQRSQEGGDHLCDPVTKRLRPHLGKRSDGWDDSVRRGVFGCSWKQVLEGIGGGVLIPRESSRLNVATTFLLWRASLF